MSDTETANKVRIDASKYDYKTNKEFRTGTGRSTIDNGDQIASMLRGMTVDGVFEVLVANGGTVEASWERLNSGMQRMNAGNKIRRIARTLPEGQQLVIPQAAIDTITRVDVEAKAAEKAAKAEAAAASKAEKAQAREQAKTARDAEKQAKAEAKAKADEEAAALKAKAEAAEQKAREKAEAAAAKEAEKAAKAAAKPAKAKKAA